MTEELSAQAPVFGSRDNLRGSGERPAVVAIGGGHGLSVTLRALTSYAGDISGIVSVADDGGSSGRLRKILGTVPPGDLRKCLVALAPKDSLLATLFEYRFHDGELNGHALGNLILTALFEHCGDLQTALNEAGKLLSAKGRVLPAAVHPVVLEADTDNGKVKGQTAVMNSGSIIHLGMQPTDPQVSDEVLSAIRNADQIVIGPGSLFTSVIAASGIPAVAREIAQACCPRVYVANLREQPGETSGYDMADHLLALREHGIVVDVVLTDPQGLSLGEIEMSGIVIEKRNISDARGLLHDPVKLGEALSGLVHL